MGEPPDWAHAFTQRITSADDRARAARLRYADAGYGYDVFGLHPAWVAVALGLARPLHDAWFRVTAHGAENIPRGGAAILAANHGGVLPFDGAMLWADVVSHTEPPRVVRPVLDHFVPRLPYVSTLFARVGAVSGSRGNVHALLDGGELLMVFPEGTRGIGKPYRARYQLQRWSVGHAEMAIRHRAPVVPVAIVGPDAQFPWVARLPVRWFGAPYFPIGVPPVPLPVHYHIYYGTPLALHARWSAADADDPRAVRAAADNVRDAVEALIARGLRERRGVFR